MITKLRSSARRVSKAHSSAVTRSAAGCTIFSWKEHHLIAKDAGRRMIRPCAGFESVMDPRSLQYFSDLFAQRQHTIEERFRPKRTTEDGEFPVGTGERRFLLSHPKRAIRLDVLSTDGGHPPVRTEVRQHVQIDPSLCRINALASPSALVIDDRLQRLAQGDLADFR